jgi:hypothetical protein
MTKLEMHRVASKFAPRLLAQDQRNSRVALCQELLDCASEDENFLKRIVTSDETWVYRYDVKTKMQSSQWVGRNLQRRKKVYCVRPKVKVVLTVFFFFAIECVVHHEFICQGQTMNRWYYLEVLKCLRENVRRKRPQLWRNNNSWFLHHDNAPAHASLLIRDFLANTNITMLHQPPYSPDLALADFCLFPELKFTLKG